MFLVRLATVLACMFGASQAHAVETTLTESTSSYEIVNAFMKYIQESVENRHVDEEDLRQLFSEDFLMIVNGTVVAEGIDGLITRFDSHFALPNEVSFQPIHSLVTSQGFVCQYDIIRPGLGISHVMGIFTVEEGRIRSMDAVVHRTPLD